MQYVNGSFGLLLVILTILHFDNSDPATWIPIYATGAVLSLAALIHGVPRWAVWLLAFATTGAMFYYFACFFRIAPNLGADWFWRDAAIDAWGLLFAANAMIFALSEYSCRIKADPEATPVRRDKSALSLLRRTPEIRESIQ